MPGVTTTAEQHRTAMVGAAIAVVVWGASGVAAKKLDMPASAIAVYRFAIFGVTLMGWMAWRKTPFTMRALKASLPGGVCLAADVFLYFYAVKHTSITNATLIGALQPILVMGVSARFYGERPGVRDVGAAMVALSGVAVVVIAGSGQPTWSGLGDLAAVGAMFSWGGYFVTSRHAQHKITSTEFTAGTSLWTAALNVPLALVTSQTLAPPDSGRQWALLLFMTFGVGLFGSSLMNWAIPQLALWLSSVMTLVIPIVAAVLAWWILDEAITGIQIAAMVVVLGALAVIVLGQNSRPAAAEATVETSPA